MKYKLTIMILLVVLGSAINLYANEKDSSVQEVIEINDTNFPDTHLQKKVKEKDSNHDGILQNSEMKKIKKIKISLEEEYYSDEMNNSNVEKNYYKIDCKGLEYLTQLKELYLEVSCVESDVKDRGFLNFSKVYKIKNLEKLTLIGDNKVNTFKFHKLEKLKKLKVIRVKNIKKITFNKNIIDLALNTVSGKAKVDLSGLKKLKTFKASTLNLKKVTFRKNYNLTKIEINSLTSNPNKHIKDINVSGLKNLKDLYVNNCKNLKSIKFGENKKLEKIIVNSPKLKNVNLKALKKVKYISVNKKTKVKGLWKGFKGRIMYIK